MESGTIGMSSQHERAGDEEYGAEPTAQFDAFRARRADEREQQETQSEYVFPEEYAAGPRPEAGFPPQQPPMPPYGGYGPEDPSGGPGAPKPRWRSVAIFGGAVLVAAALGLGVWAALDSGGAPAGSAAAGGTATGTATAASTGAAGKRTAGGVLTFRVTISSIGTGSFTGTVLANGENVTVKLTSATRFGTKAHPFTESELSPGETVIVRARRTGSATVTATLVAANTTASADPGIGAAA